MTILQTAPQPAAHPTRRTTPLPGVSRRRSLPHILLGAVLVVVCALAFAVTALRVDPRTAVLAVAHPVSAGQVLSDADLTVVRIVPDSSLGVLSEAQRSSVVGRTVRLPLAASSLLSEAVLGPAAWPRAGQSLIAVSVKAGRAPDGMAAGSQVLVLLIPNQSSTASPVSGNALQAQATVVSLAAADTTGASVVSLLMTSTDAVRVAGASGEVALVVQGGNG